MSDLVIPKAFASRRWDALALFSGGLDSILAVKVLQEQGVHVLGLHYISPFFGKPHLLGHWRDEYGIDVLPVDVRREYLDMLTAPKNGYGKHLNPCVDCKILMLRHARGLLARFGAKFLVSGEVLGQRPMSQRADSLNLIRKGAGVVDVLLRPLSAQKLNPTPMELSGLVDRERLPGLFGRGRKGQMELAEHFGVTDIPTPAGGCRLAEAEPAARYLPVLVNLADPGPEDFGLTHLGRQYWAGPYWLTIGRSEESNLRIEAAAREDDLQIRLKDIPGPFAIGRQYVPANASGHAPQAWPEEVLADALSFVASYSPRARAEAEAGRTVEMLLRQGDTARVVATLPARSTSLDWKEPKSQAVSWWKKHKTL